MGVQGGINRLIGTAAFAGATISKLSEHLAKVATKASEAANNNAKAGYTEEANKKLENKKLIEERLNNIKNKKLDLEEKALKIKARDLRTKDKESKLNAQKIKDKEAAYAEKTAKKETSAPSKFEPVTPENSKTNVDASNPDVAALIEVRQKNAMRVMGGNKTAQKMLEQKQVYAKSHNGQFDEENFKKYREEFGFSKSSAEYAKVGLDKQYLQKYALSKGETGEEVSEFISGIGDQLRNKYKGDSDATDYIDMLEDKLQAAHGSFTDYEDGDKLFDWRQLQDDVDAAVEDLASGKYKIEAQKMRNGGLTDAEVEATEPSENKYFVWDENNIEDEDEGIVF